MWVSSHKPLYLPQVFKVIIYTHGRYEIEGVVYIFNGGIQSLYNNTSINPCFDAITDNIYREVSSSLFIVCERVLVT